MEKNPSSEPPKILKTGPRLSQKRTKLTQESVFHTLLMFTLLKTSNEQKYQQERGNINDLKAFALAS